MHRKYLYNSITVNLPKNIFQFAIGSILFWCVFNTLNITIFLLACLSFLLVYSSVYIINDINDIEEDKKDTEKIKWKLIADGKIGLRDAKILAFLLSTSGFLLAFFINKWFLLIIFSMFLLNLLHSARPTRFKKSKWKTMINMTTIEFFKYSAGWFALTSNLSSFPFFLILTFSAAYVICYFAYKYRFDKKIMKKNINVFIILSFLTFFSFSASIILYTFPLSLIITTISMCALFFLLKYKNVWIYSRLSDINILMNLILIIPIISFIIIANPVIAHINQEMNKTISMYKENISVKLPEDVKKPFNTFSSKIEKYGDLRKIESELNLTIKEFSNTILSK